MSGVAVGSQPTGWIKVTAASTKVRKGDEYSDREKVHLYRQRSLTDRRCV
jgi:hypothetical protein